MMIIPESLRTICITGHKVSLRPLLASDFPTLMSIRACEETSQIMGRNIPTASELLKYMDRVIEGDAMGKWHYWAVVEKQTGASVGTFCLWQLNEQAKTAEIGYELIREARGKGYIDEAYQLVLPHAKQLGFLYLEAAVSESNKPSMKVLKRLGFKRLGQFTEVNDFDEPMKMYVYQSPKL